MSPFCCMHGPTASGHMTMLTLDHLNFGKNILHHMLHALIHSSKIFAIAHSMDLPDFNFDNVRTTDSSNDSQNDHIIPPSPQPFSFGISLPVEPLSLDNINDPHNGSFDMSSFDWTDPSLFDAMRAMISDLPPDMSSLLRNSPERVKPSPHAHSSNHNISDLTDEHTCLPSPEQDASLTLPAHDVSNPTVFFTDRIMERGDSSSWASRNPTHPVIPTRSHPACLTEAQKASRALKTAQNKEQFKDHRKKLHELALAHHVSDKHVKNLIGLQTHYKKTREPQLHNALIHAKAKEVNNGLMHGQKYTMADVQKMVAEDPDMHNLTCEQKKEFIKQLMDHHELQTSGVQASNVAAARDAVAVMDGVSKENGIYATVLMVRGHVNNQIQSTWIATDNASEFWEDRMEVALDDVAHQFEEWACIQKKNIFAREDHASLQRQVTTLILSRLRRATGKMDITMNYQNYNKSIILIYGIKLDGWPIGLPFLAPSHMHTIVEVHTLRDALKTGTCQWKKLTRRELEDFHKDIKKREEAGEVVGTVCKKRADAGKVRKCKAPTDDSANASGEKENEPSSKEKRKSCTGKQSSCLKRVQPRSCEIIEDSEVEQAIDSS
ncbi:hypothetical protein BD769DRAFT_1393946 [Suillus cothurnatus]|nr:hypothetical protein BD769DRAFT_1393946 [Suillus cothurnatus]